MPGWPMTMQHIVNQPSLIEPSGLMTTLIAEKHGMGYNIY